MLSSLLSKFRSRDARRGAQYLASKQGKCIYPGIFVSKTVGLFVGSFCWQMHLRYRSIPGAEVIERTYLQTYRTGASSTIHRETACPTIVELGPVPTSTSRSGERVASGSISPRNLTPSPAISCGTRGKKIGANIVTTSETYSRFHVNIENIEN